jgi:hypothetical protein
MPKFSHLFNPLMLHSPEAFQSGGNVDIFKNMVSKVRSMNWLNIFVNIILPLFVAIYAFSMLKDRYKKKKSESEFAQMLY